MAQCLHSFVGNREPLESSGTQKFTMNTIAILLLSNVDSRVASGPLQSERSPFHHIWASVLSKKSLRAFIRDILDLISSGSLAEAAS